MLAGTARVGTECQATISIAAEPLQTSFFASPAEDGVVEMTWETSC